MRRQLQCSLCDLPCIPSTWLYYGGCWSVHDFSMWIGGAKTIPCALGITKAMLDYETTMRAAGTELLPWEYPDE